MNEQTREKNKEKKRDKTMARIDGREEKPSPQSTKKTAVVDVYLTALFSGWRRPLHFLLVNIDWEKCSVVNVDWTFHDQMSCAEPFTCYIF